MEPPNNGSFSVAPCREVVLISEVDLHKMSNWCILVCPLSEVVLISLSEAPLYYNIVTSERPPHISPPLQLRFSVWLLFCEQDFIFPSLLADIMTRRSPARGNERASGDETS